MTTKIEQIEQQLADLQEQLAALKQESTVKESKKTPWALGDVADDGYMVCSLFDGDALAGTRCNLSDINCFASEDVAKGFANAFHVMVALRQCEGAGEFDADGRGNVVDEYDENACWPQNASPRLALFHPFPSEELAKAAADKVGRDKIAAAYKFLMSGN